VFQSNKGEFTLDLSEAKGVLDVEWFNVNLDRAVPAKPVEGGGVRTFTTPFPVRRYCMCMSANDSRGVRESADGTMN